MCVQEKNAWPINCTGLGFRAVYMWFVNDNNKYSNTKWDNEVKKLEIYRMNNMKGDETSEWMNDEFCYGSFMAESTNLELHQNPKILNRPKLSYFFFELLQINGCCVRRVFRSKGNLLSKYLKTSH